jgi:hypothetical protein
LIQFWGFLKKFQRVEPLVFPAHEPVSPNQSSALKIHPNLS